MKKASVAILNEADWKVAWALVERGGGHGVRVSTLMRERKLLAVDVPKSLAKLRANGLVRTAGWGSGAKWYANPTEIRKADEIEMRRQSLEWPKDRSALGDMNVGWARAAESTVAIECEHGVDVCPKCDGGRS